jgi:hypothetical protein
MELAENKYEFNEEMGAMHKEAVSCENTHVPYRICPQGTRDVNDIGFLNSVGGWTQVEHLLPKRERTCSS